MIAYLDFYVNSNSEHHPVLWFTLAIVCLILWLIQVIRFKRKGKQWQNKRTRS